MGRILRFLSIIAVGLLPFGFVATQEVHAAPTWPNFLAANCFTVSGSNATISCAPGGFVTSQINSGYGCNQLDMNVQDLQNGPFLLTVTADSGSVSQSVSIDGPGSYFIQIPGFLVNNLMQVELGTPDGGSISIVLSTGPCPVPTSTPVPSDTATPNPSDTATTIPDTDTPGPSQTPTVIRTNTPFPSGKSTFTRTPTRTVTPATATPTRGSPTPTPNSYRDCGTPSFPLLNCDFTGGVVWPTAPDLWVDGYQAAGGWAACGSPDIVQEYAADFYVGTRWICYQMVTPNSSGTTVIQYQFDSGDGLGMYWGNGSNSFGYLNQLSGSCAIGSATYCYGSLGSVTAGSAVYFGLQSADGCGNCNYYETVRIQSVWVESGGTSGSPTTTPTALASPTGGTPTPVVSPGTATAIARLTLTAIAAEWTSTPIPIPGVQETLVATDTPCPNGCAVAQLTSIPGAIMTALPIDTSPFSAFAHLNLSRSSCSPFGWAQIPYPVIHGTPSFGSTNPISYTWTVPVTSDWDNTRPYSNTALQPCAVSEIPSILWDFTYWFSVLMIGITFIMWLIGYVGRLSGDETING